MAYDEKLAERVRRRLVARSGFSERKMFGGLCFLLNGNMCCGIQGDDLMLRVRPDNYEAALERLGARPMDFTGRRLRGMVYVGSDALMPSRTLQSWLDQATTFVETLPAKKSRKSASGTRRRREVSR
jgi:TfoX/Sxy family transcriptional regulator of competence genes